MRASICPTPTHCLTRPYALFYQASLDRPFYQSAKLRFFLNDSVGTAFFNEVFLKNMTLTYNLVSYAKKCGKDGLSYQKKT